LWDDTLEVRTTSFGELTLNKDIECVFKRCHEHQLKKIIKRTAHARKLLSPKTQCDKQKDEAGFIKELAEHESGEKLEAALVFAKQVSKNLGPSFSLPEALLKEAKDLAKLVSKNSWTKQRILLGLMKPALPNLVCGAAVVVFNVWLRSMYMHPGPWTEIIETAKDDLPAGYNLLCNCWIAFLAIEITERIYNGYDFRATLLFEKGVRIAVLSAMMRQDTEYFDKTTPGLLQDRLNRDTSELGKNLIDLPFATLRRGTRMAGAIVGVCYAMPLRLCVVALAPLLLMIPLQYFIFKLQRKTRSRSRKVEQAVVASTSQLLREVKTVRQFAMEPQESARYARQELTRWLFEEQVGSRAASLFLGLVIPTQHIYPKHTREHAQTRTNLRTTYSNHKSDVHPAEGWRHGLLAAVLDRVLSDSVPGHTVRGVGRDEG
jgi:hypothetical protein